MILKSNYFEHFPPLHIIHLGKSDTIRESIQASGVRKAFLRIVLCILLAGKGVMKISFFSMCVQPL